MMTTFGIRSPFLLAILPPAFLLFPIMANYMEEEAKPASQIAADRARLFKQFQACALCFLMLFCTLLLSVLGIRANSVRLNAAASIGVGVVVLICFSLVLNPVIAKVNAFFLIQSSMSLSISGASFYFYTDGKEQFPKGPHFTEGFFVSFMGIVNGVFALIGVYTYQRYMSGWTYRKLLVVGNVACSLFSLTDIVIFTRLNVRLGLRDEFFVAGSAAVTDVVAQWMYMPG